MKKMLTGLGLLFAAHTTYAVDATPLFSFYIGAGIWQSEWEGDIGNSSTDLDQLGLAEEEQNTYIYATLEHAVPVLPNFRLELSELSVSGSGTLEETLDIDGDTIAVNADVSSDLSLEFVDLTLFYEIAFIDLGITLRQFDAEVEFVDNSGTDGVISESVSGVLPMGYLQGRFSFPGSGLFILGSLNTISIDDNSITDFKAALGWEKNLSFIARIAAELGYRSFAVELGVDEDFSADIETSGPYLGLEVKF